MSTNYLWMVNMLPGSISSIVEVGSRDALDAIFLSNHFGVKVIAFEPNPKQFEICQSNIERIKPNQVIIRSEALSNSSGMVEFGVVDPAIYPNPGSSSMFEIDFSNRRKSDPDFMRPTIQSYVAVKASRWDSLNLKTPELLAMDCEGSELKVLQGFGTSLIDLKYIVLELNQTPLGKGACTFKEVDQFLSSNKFKFFACNVSISKFLPRKILTNLYLLNIYFLLTAIRNHFLHPGKSSIRGMSFDALYVSEKL